MPPYVEYSEYDDFASRVYQDEPIVIDDAQIEAFTPPEYRAMRKIALGGGAKRESDAKIFYKQGKFMEGFEDDFDYKGDFFQYFPTYQSMNNHQLRGYFSWRTKLRRGVIEKTFISFAFVYIFELINQIDVREPEEGFYALKNFWTVYTDIDPRINRFKLWLTDYVIYYNLDKSLLEGLLNTDFDDTVLTLLDHKSHDANEVFSALNSLSLYNFEKSVFFRKYSDDVKNVTCSVFSALPGSYNKDDNSENDFYKKFFGRFYISLYNMFGGAVFYDKIRYKDFVYNINDLYEYTCKNGKWSYQRFYLYNNKKQQIGVIMKAIDFTMRLKYNFKPALKAVKADKTLYDIINKTIDDYQEKQREAARPKIEIDISSLQNIRNAALETQNKLLVEAESEEPEKPVEPHKELKTTEFLDKTSDPKSADLKSDAGLGDIEYRFMQCLLYSHDYRDTVQSKGQPLSVLVDAINEHFFDRFGDTVIIETEGRVELIADYVEELKEIIKE